MIAAKTTDHEIPGVSEPDAERVCSEADQDVCHEKEDWWEAAEVEAQASISVGLTQAKEGVVAPYGEAMKKYRK